jgi:hypothetical protein
MYHKKPSVSRFPKQKLNGMHEKEKINYLDNHVNLGESQDRLWPLVSRFPKERVNGMHENEKINYLDNYVNLGGKIRIDHGLSWG